MKGVFKGLTNNISVKWKEFDKAINVEPEKKFSTEPQLEIKPNEKDETSMDELEKMMDERLQNFLKNMENKNDSKTKISKMNKIAYDSKNKIIYFSFEGCSNLYKLEFDGDKPIGIFITATIIEYFLKYLKKDLII